MRLLAFRHVPFEDLGLIAVSLGEAGIDYQYIESYRETALPGAADADAFVFLGGPMSANDDLAYLRQEQALIRELAEAGKPVLGICLGAQLIARALGARVYRNAVKEIGWAPVFFTQAARRDALFESYKGPETIFHWHGETFDLPPGAELLAYSDACRHQAFRVGNNIYGLQFHLEVTPAMIEDWCCEDANQGDMREVTAPIDPNANAARLLEISREVFGRWCGRLA